VDDYLLEHARAVASQLGLSKKGEIETIRTALVLAERRAIKVFKDAAARANEILAEK
jgi:hypothetical protein